MTEGRTRWPGVLGRKCADPARSADSIQVCCQSELGGVGGQDKARLWRLNRAAVEGIDVRVPPLKFFDG